MRQPRLTASVTPKFIQTNRLIIMLIVHCLIKKNVLIEVINT